MITLHIIAVIAGLILLVWSAERFVEGASALAKIAGMSPLMIGMIVIGFGTSAPELIVSAISAWQGNSELALGNAYGSNIVNIGLVLGIGAIIAPLAMPRRLVFRELSVLVIVTLLCFYWLLDNEISRLDAIVMLLLFAALTTVSIIHTKKYKIIPDETQAIPNIGLKQTICLIAIGLIIMLIAAYIMVWGAVEIAKSLGVSDLVIGLTVVAIGTSLPELASTIAAARKGDTELVFGNIIGSNLFNTLAVVGIAGIIKPFEANSEILHRDLPVMAGMTIFLFLLGFRRLGRNTEIGSLQGILLCSSFFAYTGYLIYSQLGAAHG